MGALDTIKLRSFLKLLEAYGFKKAGQKGSHIRFTKQGINRPIIVAAHGKEIKLYLAKEAAKAIGLSPQQLLNELKKY